MKEIMDQLLAIKISVICLVGTIFIYFLFNFKYGQEQLGLRTKLQTAASGFAANFFDTFGVGSFSSYFALRNLFGLMPDSKRYNGTLVVQATLPTMLQSILFLQLVKIDSLTLIVSCLAIAFGGIASGYFVKYVSKRTIYNVMLVTFSLTAIILILSKMQMLNVGGDLTQVRGAKLIVLGVIMFLAGCLPAFGVGYYSIVLVVIFLLGLSPAVAYPIMTTASAVQMPMTAVAMIKHRQFYALSALILAITGCAAVFVAAPIISTIDAAMLKWILLAVLIYNVWMLMKAKFELKLTSGGK